LFEFATDITEAWIRACSGDVEKVVVALAVKVLLMTPTVDFFQFGIWKLYMTGVSRKQ
jgi:hypothetical protein